MMLFNNKYSKKSWGLLVKNDYENAIIYSRKAIKTGEKSFLPFFIQGLSLFNLERVDESIEITTSGLNQFNNQTDLLAVLGGCLIRKNKINEAEEILKNALAINENNGLAWAHLSWTYFDQRKYSLSLESATRALTIQPGDSGAKCNMAGCLKEMRQVEESIRLYKEVIQQNPKISEAWVGILFTMLFSERFDVDEHSNIVKEYVKTLRKNTFPEFKSIKSNEIRKISIGVLSEDIRSHPCAYYLIPFIANINNAYAEVSIYSLSKKTDNVTLKIKKLVNRFVDLSDLDIPQVVNRIREDNLDILIDLGGYTGKSPLRYMVHRLAKIQCSWLGYPASTQMKEIDFRITDEFANLSSQDKNYTEILLKNKNNFFTYAPLVSRPLMIYDIKYAIQKCPFLNNGYITFGSCNNLAKISNTTIRVWCEILKSVPKSKILIEADNIERADVSADLLNLFSSFGVSKDRIILLNRSGENQYLTYNLIDIALDTMPLTGGTTTVDCLWMGVPVITKIGAFFHTRLSGSILNSISLNDFICESDEDYIIKAVSLANNLDKLIELRRLIRSKFEQSSLMDHYGFSNWVLSCFYSQLSPSNTPKLTDHKESLYFDGVLYTLEDLKRAVIILYENKEFPKLLILLENMSTKWPRHWIVAFSLSELDRLEGKNESSIYKLNIAIDLNKYCEKLNKIWFERTNEMKNEFSDYYFSLKRDVKISKEEFIASEAPSFRDVILSKQL